MSLMGNAEPLDAESSQLKRLGKCRSRTSKAEYPPDCNGADIDADQNGQGASTSREEKVSSLKTGLVHVARKMPKNVHAHFVLGLMYQRMGQPQKAILAYEKAEEILLHSEEEIDRPELLSVVQIHHAQCILLESLENCLDRELEPQELDEICSKLRESIKSDVRQASVWNTLGLILLKTGRLKGAISVFSSLLDIIPDNLDCLGNLGITYLQRCGSVVAGAGANADGGRLGTYLIMRSGSKANFDSQTGSTLCLDRNCDRNNTLMNSANSFADSRTPMITIYNPSCPIVQPPMVIHTENKNDG